MTTAVQEDMFRENEMDRAREWRKKRPKAYQAFVELGLRAASLKRKFGWKGVAEKVRWDRTIENEDPRSEYKIPNTLITYIGRLIEQDHPHLAQFTTKGQAKWDPQNGKEDR